MHDKEGYVRRALEWLPKQLLSSDTSLLEIAVANWLHLRYLALYGAYCSGGVVSPWYCDWTWYSCANRLVIAALCIRSRRAWLEILGFLAAAHVLAAQLFYVVNADEFFKISLDVKEMGILEAVFRHTIVQGCIAIIIVIFAAVRSIRRISGLRIYRMIATTSGIGAIVLFLGYASNFLSHAATETETARWINDEVLKRSSFYGKTPDGYLDESANRFANVGAHVLEFDSDRLFEKLPFGQVGPTYYLGPFLASVQYIYAFKDSKNLQSGNCLILNVFGYVKILDRDSMIWNRMIPYLWPY